MATSSTPAAALPSGIKRYEDYLEQSKVKSTSSSMDQTAFLTLFTTQLKNQNPLDPVKNEAFVAQLAQFSQLEALTSMKGSMENLSSALLGERMLASASLIGRKVAVPNGPLVLQDSQPVSATVDLPTGADGMQMEILDAKGQVVRKQILGSQPVGASTLSWDGKNEGGALMPDGVYSMRVLVSSQGKAIQPVVNTYSTVKSVSKAGTTENVWLLEVEGGKTVKMDDVHRIAF